MNFMIMMHIYTSSIQKKGPQQKWCSQNKLFFHSNEKWRYHSYHSQQRTVCADTLSSNCIIIWRQFCRDFLSPRDSYILLASDIRAILSSLHGSMFSGKCLPAISKALAWSLSLSECSEPSTKPNLTIKKYRYQFLGFLYSFGNTCKEEY